MELGPRARSCDAAYRKHKGKEKGEANSSFRAWFQLLEWEKRALAWDAHIATLRRAELEKVHLEQVEDFHQRQRKKAQLKDALVVKLAGKIGKRIDDLQADEIEVKTIAPLLRAIAHLSDSATNSEATALGIDALAEMLEEPD